MGKRRYLGTTVLDESIDRIERLYRDGHRVVVSFSGGKDSGVMLELAIIAATNAGRLPVTVMMRDDEVMLPGTFEYCERVASRPEVDFHWIYANQPVINVFNRVLPYWWVFDPLLPPESWVRRPPSYSYKVDELAISRVIIPSRFPPEPGKDLITLIGNRTSESHFRLMGIFSSKSYITAPNSDGTKYARPIYDWQDGDIWKAIRDLKLDYNTAYDVMARYGRSRDKLRIAPPTMSFHGVPELQIAAKAWPAWFDAVCNRLDGVRMAAKYGIKAALPMRRHGETWEQCFKRVCLTDAPDWIIKRSTFVMNYCLNFHARHSSQPYPDVSACPVCEGKIKCWRDLTLKMYNGDPFSTHNLSFLPYIEPEFFREGAGKWGGKPMF